MIQPFDDSYFMKRALQEAETAFEKGEVPVGAVVVIDNKIIARGHNLTETLNDVTAHAEMQAITSAANFIGGKYLAGCTLYVTLEPCPMCAGAIKWARLDRLVYGAGDDKAGFMQFGKELLHKTTKLEYGVHNDECRHLMKSFFKAGRSIPIASQKEDPEILNQAYIQINEVLDAGDVLGIFPEGGITASGDINTFKKGIERIVDQQPAPVTVVPMALCNLWGSLFSRRDPLHKRRPYKFRALIELRVGQPIPAEELTAERLEHEVRQLRGDAR